MCVDVRMFGVYVFKYVNCTIVSTVLIDPVFKPTTVDLVIFPAFLATPCVLFCPPSCRLHIPGQLTFAMFSSYQFLKAFEGK